ncbi:hypothetical protein QYE76_048513 [Lolium multiflorum]|uniref:RNase H type-1 domain-containing protein n=1 Tax=Lolium multiflorum TaxID=4521 RepID=A0AAD8WFF7_LOLMU|nr:hypothetical protein QYE76_048513 [Lolium multiflorum]
MATVGFVNNVLSDLDAVREEAQLQQRKPAAVPRQPSWIAPPAGRSKINVDAAVAKSDSKGAVAAVCRSRNGTYLGASAMVYEGITDPRCLEALACREVRTFADGPWRHTQLKHSANSPGFDDRGEGVGEVDAGAEKAT